MRFLLFSLFIVSSQAVFAQGKFGNACAIDATEYLGGADSPISVDSHGVITVDSKSKCKPKFDKSNGSREIYSFSCPKSDASEKLTYNKILIRREKGLPTEITNTVSWQSADGKSEWENYFARRVVYNHESGSCVVERQESESGDKNKITIWYDRSTCDRINNIPELNSGFLAKCSDAINKVASIARDFTIDLIKRSEAVGARKIVFAFESSDSVLDLVARCKSRGLPYYDDDCPECRPKVLRENDNSRGVPKKTVK